MAEPQAPQDQKAALPARAIATVSRSTQMIPQDLSQAMEIAKMLAGSDAIPREFMGKPNNVLLAVMHGHAVGLSPAQALSSMMVINNRVSIFGDALLGIVKTSPEYEWSKDSYDPNVEGGTASFTVKRRSEDPVTRTFSKDDAVKAGLWGKAGPWQGYPKRMLYMRARAFALRDVFGDVLKGLRVVEEQQDIIETTLYEMPAASPAAEIRAAMQPAAETAAPKTETKAPEQETAQPKVETPSPKVETPAPQPAAQAVAPAKRKSRFA